MRCATTLIASLSMAAAMRLPAMAVPSSSLAPRMYDLRGGGKAVSSSPFDMLKGRKIVLTSACIICPPHAIDETLVVDLRTGTGLGR